MEDGVQSTAKITLHHWDKIEKGTVGTSLAVLTRIAMAVRSSPREAYREYGISDDQLVVVAHGEAIGKEGPDLHPEEMNELEHAATRVEGLLKQAFREMEGLKELISMRCPKR